MARMLDETTSLELGDPERIPLSGVLPDRTALARALDPLILSASGWRKVFARSGDEESADTGITPADTVLVAHMAAAFADYLVDRGERTMPVFLGTDTRPTGPAIADVMCRVFLAKGFEVRYLFIAAAPEIMARARGLGSFAYVSASHNPIGHNGVKFGLADGGVLPGNEAALLISRYRAAVADPLSAEKASALVGACPSGSVAAVYSRVGREKAEALRSYRAFTREIVSGEGDGPRQEGFFRDLADAVAKGRDEGRPFSVVADFNGSARTVSIDSPLMAELGIPLFAMNGAPRAIAHRIVPEGEGLVPCANEIARLRAEGTSDEQRNALLGYVPDCDGDRGNIVFWDEAGKAPAILEAQEVFALSVIAELSHLVYAGKVRPPEAGAVPRVSVPPVAVAVNDPTSLRIEDIAGAFGATVHRAEVGEANVVNLARSLRESGHVVRILGEGSNGGNITHPSSVRDPIDTVFALLKILTIRDKDGIPGLFHIWCSLSGQESSYREDFTFADVRATLPAFATTSVFEEEARLSVRTADHAALKRRFGKLFLSEWLMRKDDLARDFGVSSWRAVAYNGTAHSDCSEDFGRSGTGGLKIVMSDAAGTDILCLWLRGSGTESVFRVMADSRGADRSRERFLLSWLRRMVLEADTQIV